MSITLTADQEKLIAELLKSGSYRSAEDVITQSLGMLRAQEEFIQSNVLELREKIAVGLREIRNSESIDGKTSLKSIREQLRQRHLVGI